MAKVMRKEASAYAKVGSSLRKPPVPEHLPQNQGLPTLLFHALTYTSDFIGSWGAQLGALRRPRGAGRGAEVPGASVRNSAHGKGHEEGGFGIRKGMIKPQETPYSRASTPQTRVYLLYCFMLLPIPLTLRGADPHYLSRRRS